MGAQLDERTLRRADGYRQVMQEAGLAAPTKLSVDQRLAGPFIRYDVIEDRVEREVNRLDPAVLHEVDGEVGEDQRDEDDARGAHHLGDGPTEALLHVVERDVGGLQLAGERVGVG